jgi:YHYH protein
MKLFSARNPLGEGVCPPVPTPTPTATPTATLTASPTPTFTPSPTPTATGAAACAAANFLDVSGAPGPGGTYASLHPSLSASCGASTVSVNSNGIPTYEYVALTPNGLQAKSYAFTFPRYPAIAASMTNVPLLGNVGVAVNGIPIYGVNEGAQPTSDAYGDPIAANILDECGSHSAQQGTFHNHKLLVKCLTQAAVAESQPWNDPDPSPSSPSPIIGYAFDGFPIYGPYECVDVGCSSVQKMLSSWDNTGYQAGTVGCTSSASCSSGYCTDVMINGAQTTACVPKTCVWSNNDYSVKVGPQYLDQCNGHTGPNGDYHYHTTDTFPYILGCYRGTATNNGGSGTPPGGTCP